MASSSPQGASLRIWAGITPLAVAWCPPRCRAACSRSNRGGPPPRRRPISARGQQRAGSPRSACRAASRRAAGAARLAGDSCALRPMASSVGGCCSGPVHRGPLTASGGACSAPQRQADQPRSRSSDCTCWSPQPWQWASRPSWPSSPGAGRRRKRTAVRKVRPSLKLNRGSTPRPRIQAARATAPNCSRRASSQLAGWARAAAPSRRIAATRSWPVGERPSVLAR